MKTLFAFVLLLLSVSSFAQNAQQNARIKEIRELNALTQSTIKDMAEGGLPNLFFKAEAVVNESAVGPVNYKYEYYIASYVGGSNVGDFARMKRTVTVFPADVYEVLYNTDGTPAFYFEVNRSYQDEGCHVDTRIYWNADGKTVCYISREAVSADGKKTPVTLSEGDKEYAISNAYSCAVGLSEKCIHFYESIAKDDDEEMGDDYTGHSMQMWSEYRSKMQPLLPKCDGKTQKITEYAYLDIDGDATLECIARTDCGQTAVFTNGNNDGIATDEIKLVACFDNSGVHLIPDGHAVVTYEGVSIGYERENVYIIEKSKVKSVLSYSADPQGGNKIKFAYKKLDKSTGKTAVITEKEYNAEKNKIGDNWYSEDSLEWFDY